MVPASTLPCFSSRPMRSSSQRIIISDYNVTLTETSMSLCQGKSLWMIQAVSKTYCYAWITSYCLVSLHRTRVTLIPSFIFVIEIQRSSLWVVLAANSTPQSPWYETGHGGPWKYIYLDKMTNDLSLLLLSNSTFAVACFATLHSTLSSNRACCPSQRA